MASFTLQEIETATGGKAFHCSQVTCEAVQTDTRAITKGAVFVALKGEHFDGHDYIEEALMKGAVLVIVEKKPQRHIPYVLVKNTLKAYQDLAHYHRMRYDIPVIAITGSSGKTTTKEMVATILSMKYEVLKTEKNFNNEIGLPKTLLELTDRHEVCVVEMGMRGFGQIAELCAIAKPTHGIITNIGTSHIELLGSQEGIAKAKGELVESINEDGYVILNDDDTYVKSMKANAKSHIVTYGIHGHPTVRAFDLRYKVDGIKFACNWYDEVFDIFMPLIGLYNVYDALSAIAIGRLLGVSSAKINKALGEFKSISMRQELINKGSYVICNDTYNANPSSMEEAIRALGQLSSKRKVAILGDMLELGTYSEEAHRHIGRLLVAEGYELVILLGKAVSYTAEEARAGGIGKVYYCQSHDEIVAVYKGEALEGDSILIKGSRGMAMEKVAEIL